MRLLILIFVLSLSACVGQELNEDVSGIVVLDSFPLCDYESLGPVEGRDGHTGHSGGSIWGQEGTEERALQRLKLAARKLGADAVIMVVRNASQRQNDGGSVNRRPSRLVVLKGIAIRNCS